MKMIGSKIEHPILVMLAALVLVFSAVGVEQAAAQEGLPRTPLIEQGPAVAPYNPPAVNNPSERVMQSDQSFQLDRGIGNNPTNRDEYVRERGSEPSKHTNIGDHMPPSHRRYADWTIGPMPDP